MIYQSKQAPPPRKPIGALTFPPDRIFVSGGCCVVIEGNDSLISILKQHTDNRNEYFQYYSLNES